MENIQTETFYGNENETYYVDQFSRIWLIQSVDFTGEIQHELHTELPSGVIEVNGDDLEIPDAVFELPETAENEVITKATTDAQVFVDEYGAAFNPQTDGDWDSEAFDMIKLSFNHKENQITYSQTWELYHETFAQKTLELS